MKVPDTSDGDQHGRRLIRVAVPSHKGAFQPIIHHNCIHNQLVAVRNRVVGVVPKPSSYGNQLLLDAAKTIARLIPATTAHSIYEMPNRHSGAKRERYLVAADDYIHRGVKRSDSFCKMFVKAERLDPNAKVNPDPRAIQYRGAVYCVAFAKYLRPIEEFLYQSSSASDGVPRSRSVAKGLNSVDRAELLVAKLSNFNDPIVVSLDMSRFDKHVSASHLKAVHSVYLSSNPDKEFAWLLHQQLNNKCFSSLGLRYKTAARRMSGDMDTAIGNIVIMLIMVIAVCRNTLHLAKWDCLDDGDDCLVILEKPDYARFMDFAPSLFLQMGMEVTFSRSSSVVFEINFCKSRVIEYDAGRYKFVRDFRDVMSKSLCGSRNWGDSTYRSRVINATGMCELVLNLGIPVLQSFALALLRNSEGGTRRHARDGLLQRALKDASLIGCSIESVRPREITEIARETFAIAFGLDIFEQIQLENALDRWTFSNALPEVWDDDFWPIDWSGVRTCRELYPIGHD